MPNPQQAERGQTGARRFLDQGLSGQVCAWCLTQGTARERSDEHRKASRDLRSEKALAVGNSSPRSRVLSASKRPNVHVVATRSHRATLTKGDIHEQDHASVVCRSARGARGCCTHQRPAVRRRPRYAIDAEPNQSVEHRVVVGAVRKSRTSTCQWSSRFGNPGGPRLAIRAQETDRSSRASSLLSLSDFTHSTRSTLMTIEQDNKAIVDRWFTSFWGETCHLSIVDEIAAPDMLLQYSLHEPSSEERRA